MGINEVKDKLVAVLGYGQEGKSTADYLIKHGVTPVLFDQRPWDDWPKEDREKIKKLNVNFIFGPDAFKELAGFDIAFRSPGISFSHPDLRSRIKDKGSKIIITSQTKWFFENCPAKIIGVTGTKGKGTTASLIFQILKRKFQIPKIYLTGNIGKDQPLEFLDDLTANDIVVYELSSFQLQDLNKSPHIAAVLKMFTEHLDYHKDIQEYFQAKANITKYQTKDDFAVINADNQEAKKTDEWGRGKKIYFSTERELKNGCFVKDLGITVKGLAKKKFQFPISIVNLVGRHNLENVCAAVCASVLAGADETAVVGGIKKFKGLPHRLEFVAKKNGIKFYDDSISTTPETAIAAINSFSDDLILILGGSSKKSDFSELGTIIKHSKNIKAIILVGEEAKNIKEAIGKTHVQIYESAQNMGQIFDRIKQIASKGDTVLLSPACASFDMFKNYCDRGDQFKKLAEEF